MPTLDWKLRDLLPHLRDNGRLNVLIALLLRLNIRNRCYPSMRLICKDTGYAIATIEAAKEWLLEHKAMELVPYDKRVADECDLPIRQHVYQLTGTIEIDGVKYPYLYHQTNPNDEVSAIDISVGEISVGDTKGIKSPKKIKKEDNGTPNGAGRKRDPIYDAIAQAWGSDASGFILSVYGMLTGLKNPKGAWKDALVTPPATADEITAFGEWMRNNKGTDKKLWAKVPSVIQRWFVDEYRAQATKTTSAAAIDTSADDAARARARANALNMFAHMTGGNDESTKS